MFCRAGWLANIWLLSGSLCPQQVCRYTASAVISQIKVFFHSKKLVIRRQYYSVSPDLVILWRAELHISGTT